MPPQQNITWSPVVAGIPRDMGKKPQSKRGSKNKSWLSSIISEAGAVGGGALGTLLLPGVGTVIGAGLGGGLGRAAENKIRDDEYRLGDVLKEGAMSAAFAGIPGGKAASKVATVGDDVIRSGGKLTRLGNSMRANPRGIVQGLDQGGGRTLSTAQASAQNAAIDKLSKGTKGLNKTGQFTEVEKELSRLTSQYAKSKEAKRMFGQDNALSLMKRVEENIANNPNLKGSLTKSSQKTLDNIYDDIAKLGKMTNKDLIEYSAKVNKNAASIANKGQVGSKTVQVWEEVRNATKSFIDDELLSRSTTNKQLSTLLGAKKSLSKTITRDTGAGAGQGLTLGRTLSNVLGQGLEVGGRGAQKLGAVTNTTAARQATRQVGGRAVLGGATGGQPQDEDETLMQAYEQASGEMSGYGGMGGQEVMAQQPQQPTYSLQQAIADIQRDPKNAKDYMGYYEFINEAQGGGKLTAQEKKAQQQAQTALQGLQQLRSLYGSAGGGQGRIQGIAGNILGKAGGGSKANSYNQIRRSLTTTLARAFGETGVLTDQDREVYLQALPRLEDNPEEAAIKLQYLEEMLSGGGSGGYESATPDLYNALQGGF